MREPAQTKIVTPFRLSTMSVSTPEKKRKKEFSMEACAKKAKPETPVKIPKAKDLNLSAPAQWILPPEALSIRLGSPTRIMGFDIES